MMSELVFYSYRPPHEGAIKLVPPGTELPGHVITHKRKSCWIAVELRHPEGGHLRIVGSGKARRMLAEGINSQWVGQCKYAVYEFGG